MMTAGQQAVRLLRLPVAPATKILTTASLNSLIYFFEATYSISYRRLALPLDQPDSVPISRGPGQYERQLGRPPLSWSMA